MRRCVSFERRPLEDQKPEFCTKRGLSLGIVASLSNLHSWIVKAYSEVWGNYSFSTYPVPSPPCLACVQSQATICSVNYSFQLISAWLGLWTCRVAQDTPMTGKQPSRIRCHTKQSNTESGWSWLQLAYLWSFVGWICACLLLVQRESVPP